MLVHAGIHFNALLPWLATFVLMLVVALGLVGKFLLKDASASLGGIASGSVTMISSLKTFMSAANISATIPKTATDKPKPQADVDD